MKQLVQLVCIGIIAGAALAGIMQVIHLMTGSEANNLLYNVDYIPILHVFQNNSWFGIAFHFVFCVVSVVGLFYLLSIFSMAYRIWPYVLVYTIGSGVLYFLTLFTNQPPASTDISAWFYWTFSHLIFSLIVGVMVKWMSTQQKHKIA